MNVLPQRPSLQSIAAKCTKVGNEQPSKQPLKTAPKLRQIGEQPLTTSNSSDNPKTHGQKSAGSPDRSFPGNSGPCARNGKAEIGSTNNSPTSLQFAPDVSDQFNDLTLGSIERRTAICSTSSFCRPRVLISVRNRAWSVSCSSVL